MFSLKQSHTDTDPAHTHTLSHLDDCACVCAHTIILTFHRRRVRLDHLRNHHGILRGHHRDHFPAIGRRCSSHLRHRHRLVENSPLCGHCRPVTLCPASPDCPSRHGHPERWCGSATYHDHRDCHHHHHHHQLRHYHRWPLHQCPSHRQPLQLLRQQPPLRQPSSFSWTMSQKHPRDEQREPFLLS